jgi:hypothetical protein
LKLARRFIISKRDLAIAEQGEESDNDALDRYKKAFDAPLSPSQMGALTALAKEARRKGRSARAPPAAQVAQAVQ